MMDVENARGRIEGRVGERLRAADDSATQLQLDGSEAALRAGWPEAAR